MIKLEKTITPSAEQWEAIIRGMRNPMNSWEKSDSAYCTDRTDCRDCPMNDRNVHCLVTNINNHYVIGPNDHELMMKLRNAGTDHRKFMRMIVVYVDITAPLYWWKEFDTYKVGTVANSCSTMHKIHAEPFSLENFSHELLMADTDDDKNLDIPMVQNPFDMDNAFSPMGILNMTIHMLNACRMKYLETNDKRYWQQMIQLLPSSYNQKRTVMMNYEVLANIWKSRKNHKLAEWAVDICEWIEMLPYSEIITGEEKDVDNEKDS